MVAQAQPFPSAHIRPACRSTSALPWPVRSPVPGKSAAECNRWNGENKRATPRYVEASAVVTNEVRVTPLGRSKPTSTSRSTWTLNCALPEVPPGTSRGGGRRRCDKPLSDHEGDGAIGGALREPIADAVGEAGQVDGLSVELRLVDARELERRRSSMSSFMRSGPRHAPSADCRPLRGHRPRPRGGPG